MNHNNHQVQVDVQGIGQAQGGIDHARTEEWDPEKFEEWKQRGEHALLEMHKIEHQAEVHAVDECEVRGNQLAAEGEKVPRPKLRMPRVVTKRLRLRMPEIRRVGVNNYNDREDEPLLQASLPDQVKNNRMDAAAEEDDEVEGEGSKTDHCHQFVDGNGEADDNVIEADASSRCTDDKTLGDEEPTLKDLELPDAAADETEKTDNNAGRMQGAAATDDCDGDSTDDTDGIPLLPLDMNPFY